MRKVIDQEHPEKPALSRGGGFAVLYLAVAMVALLLGLSLAVDYGRVQCSKTQLQAATDAIARYAATGISDSSYFTKASTLAADSSVDGTALTIQSGDVVTGNWSGTAFTAGGTPTNCVRVSTTLSATRGNAVPVLFAPGVSSCNITSTSYATYSSGQAYGLVGISAVYLQNGTIYTDSWNSSTGSYSTTAPDNKGNIASNGNFTHNGTVTVNGIIYDTSSSNINGNGTFSYSSYSQLTSSMSYSVASAGTAATINNDSALGSYDSSGNFNMSSGTLNVPAGIYYLNSFNMSGGTLNINGAATFYINGNFTISGGTVNTVNDIPANFTVNVIASAGGNLSNQSAIYMVLYAPTSPINVNGCTNIFGSFVGSTFNVNGPCGIHADEALMGSTAGTVTTVH